MNSGIRNSEFGIQLFSRKFRRSVTSLRRGLRVVYLKKKKKKKSVPPEKRKNNGYKLPLVLFACRMSLAHYALDAIGTNKKKLKMASKCDSFLGLIKGVLFEYQTVKTVNIRWDFFVLV